MSRSSWNTCSKPGQRLNGRRQEDLETAWRKSVRPLFVVLSDRLLAVPIDESLYAGLTN